MAHTPRLPVVVAGSVWKPARFLIAVPLKPATVAGYVYASLGLYLVRAGSCKGRRKALWNLTHLGSGHRVTNLMGDFAVASAIATEIADCGDWSFDGIDGWRNVDPELAEKSLAIIARHGKLAKRGSGTPNHENALMVAVARAA